ncbi:MAG: glycosyltransferase family 4 protein [Verrucomicrobium sp.]
MTLPVPSPNAPAAAEIGRPRLAYLHSRYPVISQTFIDNEMLGLEAAGWDLVVVALNPPKNDVRHPRLNGLKAPILHAPPQVIRKEIETRLKAEKRWPQALIEQHAALPGVGLERAEAACRNVAGLVELLPALGVDHVHLHFANQATHSAVFLKAMTGITYSFTPQAQDFLVDLGSQELLQEMCREAEFVVTACDFAKQQLAQMCPASEAKMLRIYNGIDPGNYKHAFPQPQQGQIRIISVGRLIEFKGFHHLINAMALARTVGVHVDLDLMGDGPWLARLEQQVKDLNLGTQVTFHGTVNMEQMKAGFLKADAFVLACIVDEKGAADMLPTVITEAMLTRLPVVSSKVAGVPEQVIDGETGFLTEPGDEAALARSLVALAIEPGLAVKLGEGGERRARENFALDVTLPVLAQRFEAVVDSAKLRPKPAAAKLVAYYDLNHAESLALLEMEYPVLAAKGAQIWVRGGNLTWRELEKLQECLLHVHWLPDGMALEMEWVHWPEERGRLEKLRGELSTSVDGEVFFEAARRALWLAVQLTRFGRPQVFYAPSTNEALVAWILKQVWGMEFVVAGERVEAFDGKLRTRLFADAKGKALTREGNPLERPEVPGKNPRGLLKGIFYKKRRRVFGEWMTRYAGDTRLEDERLKT